MTGKIKNNASDASALTAEGFNIDPLLVRKMHLQNGALSRRTFDFETPLGEDSRIAKEAEILSGKERSTISTSMPKDCNRLTMEARLVLLLITTRQSRVAALTWNLEYLLSGIKF